MRLLRLINSARSRRLVGLCTLCALVIGTIGMPMPRLATKDQSQPFPCQQRACGCVNADACWKSCCCHTNGEKIAWAKKHGVKVPDFVVAAVLKEGVATAKSCCMAKASKPASCCETKAKPKSETTLGLIVFDDARKCQGQSSLVLLLSQTVAEVREIEFDFRPAYSGTVTPLSTFADSAVADLPLKPPRLFL